MAFATISLVCMIKRVCNYGLCYHIAYLQCSSGHTHVFRANCRCTPTCSAQSDMRMFSGPTVAEPLHVPHHINQSCFTILYICGIKAETLTPIVCSSGHACFRANCRWNPYLFRSTDMHVFRANCRWTPTCFAPQPIMAFMYHIPSWQSCN